MEHRGLQLRMTRIGKGIIVIRLIFPIPGIVKATKLVERLEQSGKYVQADIGQAEISPLWWQGNSRLTQPIEATTLQEPCICGAI